MSCLHPLVCCGSFRNSKTGKYLFTKIYKKEDLDPLLLYDNRKHEHWFPVPCGRCIGCRIDKAKDWSVRIMCEASLYQNNYFLTLTYAPEHYPSDFSIRKEDLRLFVKTLRNYVATSQGKHGVRFFGCGEYGSLSGRAHYHLILFNCVIPDLEFYKAANGCVYYQSDTINSFWKKGYVVIGDVTPESAQYVARYTLKKVGASEYEHRDIQAPFLIMSNHPGIGYDYWRLHKQELFDNWRVLVGHDFASLPKYFKELFKKDPDYMYQILPKLEKLEDQAFDYMFLQYCNTDASYREILDGKEIFIKSMFKNKRSDDL